MRQVIFIIKKSNKSSSDKYKDNGDDEKIRV